MQSRVNGVKISFKGGTILPLALGFQVSWAIFLGAATIASAQVTPDGTVGTVVTSGTNQLTITGGTQQLNTLFHSFADFSPGTANVLFQLQDNQSSITLVIGRITGGNSSFINGQLQLTGGNQPDLWLLNPKGITVGPNAQLRLPGSFLASTAESVLFKNNQEFTVNNPGAAPLLTVNTPIGLRGGNGFQGILITQDSSVSINEIGLDPKASSDVSTISPLDPSQQIAQGCAENQENSLVITGRGGLPQNPTQQVIYDGGTWDDLRDLAALKQSHPSSASSPSPVTQTKPATSWQYLPNQTIALIAHSSAPTTLPVATCSAAPVMNSP